ncbi:ankyrin repeat domain-containing protein [Legionella gresilensis]|uniref:ankyrin repeat domain-containing protein n=1 Tax=Legionella gresilensis TaxID=91823 RepID=UPI00104135B2|nr:ankyrin repeat domain-containing protein [Legionella gresilensis]
MHFFKDNEGQASTPSSENSPSLLDSIPNKVLWKIFSYSNPADITTLAQSSGRLYNSVKNANYFWQDMCHRHFPNTPEKIADKTWYDTFMERYKTDYPQPVVRRLVFLIKTQDDVNLKKFIEKNQDSIVHLLDIEGNVTKKTPLEHAQANGNQKILDQFFQAIELNYKKNVKEVANSKLISLAILAGLPLKTGPLSFPIHFGVHNCLIVYMNQPPSALQDLDINTSNLAIAEHHMISADADTLKQSARLCIEINMIVAATVAVIKQVMNNQKAIVDAINFINLIYFHGLNALNFNELYPLIDKFRKELENKMDQDSQSEALANLISAAEEAAYTSRADEQGRTIFYWAIACRQTPQALVGLLQMGSSLSERYMSLGYRPLHIAASLGYDEIVQLFTNISGPFIRNTGDSIFVDYHKAKNLSDYLVHRAKGYLDDSIKPEQIDEDEDEDEDEITQSEFLRLTPIHRAALCGQKETVVRFIQRDPICATFITSNKEQVIDVAIRSGQTEVVEALLKLSPIFLFRHDFEINLLKDATKFHQPNLVTLLVKHYLQRRAQLANNVSTSNLNNAMLEEVLANNGYDGTFTSTDIESAFINYLIYINDENELSCIEPFISTIYKHDDEYLNTLFVEYKFLKPEIKKVVQKICADLFLDNMFLYVKNGDVERLSRKLVSLNMLSLKNKDGYTLIQIACQEKNPLVLNYFYQLAVTFYSENNTINTKKQSNDSITILFWAIVCHQDEHVIQQLLDNGSKLDERYFTDSHQPLHIAVTYGNTKIIPFLINAGASPKAPDRSGHLPIHLAIVIGNLKAVKLFVESDKTLLEELDTSNRTLLHLAALYGHTKMMKFLIEQGCDIRATDLFGSQPIHMAIKEGYPKAVKLLLETSDDLLTEKNGENKTPQELAEMHGNTELSNLISEYENQRHRDKRQVRPT